MLVRAPRSRRPPASARVRTWRGIAPILSLTLLLWAAGTRAQTPSPNVSCVGGTCIVTPPGQAASPPPRMSVDDRAANVARGVALFGLVSAALTLSGAITLGTLDSLHAERVGRGLMLGLSAVSTPLIAISAHVARKRAHGKGVSALRNAFWVVYVGVLTTDAFFLYNAYRDAQPSLGFSILAGTGSALTVLAFSYDAFVSSREARGSSLRFGLSPGGARVQLRF